ncbi:hypothetical protein EDD17DRAFT_326978 [Pisolithus thermaeus]|nr:hypothetical protein EDD17DRAFT_326978 [Pisolithus thermaeus]
MCSGSAEFLSQRDFVGFCILSFVAMSFFVGLVMGVLTLAIASQVKGSLNSSMTILKGRFRSTCNLPECIPVVRSLCSSTNKARSAPGLIGWKTKKTSLLSPIMPLCLKQRPFPSSDHWELATTRNTFQETIQKIFAMAEHDLSCAICLGVLSQPLTLPDCGHTYCGSCLESFFSKQMEGRPSSQHSCPTCHNHATSAPVPAFILHGLLDGMSAVARET